MESEKDDDDADGDEGTDVLPVVMLIALGEEQ